MCDCLWGSYVLVHVCTIYSLMVSGMYCSIYRPECEWYGNMESSIHCITSYLCLEHSKNVATYRYKHKEPTPLAVLLTDIYFSIYFAHTRTHINTNVIYSRFGIFILLFCISPNAKKKCVGFRVQIYFAKPQIVIVLHLFIFIYFFLLVCWFRISTVK